MTSRPGGSDEAAGAPRGHGGGAGLHAQQVRAWRVHACVFALGMLVVVAVNLLTNLSAGIVGDWTAWWSLWALLGWGAGIGLHGLVVWMNRPLPWPGG